MPEWARFQRWVARKFKKAGFDAKVRAQAGGGFGVPDVESEPFHVECKSYEASRPDIPKAVMQAKVDSVGKCDRYPIAITKYRDEKPIVSMYFADFLNLRLEYENGKEENAM